MRCRVSAPDTFPAVDTSGRRNHAEVPSNSTSIRHQRGESSGGAVGAQRAAAQRRIGELPRRQCRPRRAARWRGADQPFQGHRRVQLATADQRRRTASGRGGCLGRVVLLVDAVRGARLTAGFAPAIAALRACHGVARAGGCAGRVPPTGMLAAAGLAATSCHASGWVRTIRP